MDPPSRHELSVRYWVTSKEPLLKQCIIPPIQKGIAILMTVSSVRFEKCSLVLSWRNVPKKLSVRTGSVYQAYLFFSSLCHEAWTLPCNATVPSAGSRYIQQFSDLHVMPSNYASSLLVSTSRMFSLIVPFLTHTGLCAGCWNVSVHHPVWATAERAAVEWNRTHLSTGERRQNSCHLCKDFFGNFSYGRWYETGWQKVAILNDYNTSLIWHKYTATFLNF